MSLDQSILSDTDLVCNEALTDEDLAAVKDLVELYTTYSAAHTFTCMCADCQAKKILPKLLDYVIGAKEVYRDMDDQREDLIRKNADMDDLLEQIGGFSVHYVKKPHKLEWARHLDLIDAVRTKNKEV